MATIEPRTLQDGTKRYRVRVRLQGELPRTKTFKRLTDAKAWAAKVESDLGHGTYVPTALERRRTLRELIGKYRDEYLPTRQIRDEAKQRSLLAWWDENYGHMTLDRLKPEAIAEARRRLQTRSNRDGEPLAGATVNRYLAALSAVCKWAWKELRWLPSNPVLDVSKAPESEGIVRFLSDAERTALLKTCRQSSDSNINLAVLLALATGARYSNIRYLKWSDIDLTSGRLRFVETKNRQPRYVPLIAPAKEALRAHRKADPTKEGWVFKGAHDNAPADLDKPWRKVRASAGLTDFRFHDLRHTTASYLTMNGASLAEVAEALGHRTLVMAKRYSHQTGEHVRATLERMSEHLIEAPAKAPGKRRDWVR
ncbi:tyrosine-type recombinase/integrase [Noviluteimonas gilva]|uniref:Tyrosine-type recombinase/integrase n=1 Tax=Noviluteimonas gilva TaxID=2682097 RepID=A0A7C9MMT3_9GAMM|nr:site-specific integrase [Lysobacter gilvus]MUV14687.1 tyrosine-type recombinase/integrase [Lysobacter gilvus]